MEKIIITKSTLTLIRKSAIWPISLENRLKDNSYDGHWSNEEMPGILIHAKSILHHGIQSRGIGIRQYFPGTKKKLLKSLIKTTKRSKIRSYLWIARSRQNSSLFRPAISWKTKKWLELVLTWRDYKSFTKIERSCSREKLTTTLENITWEPQKSQ